VKTGSGNPGAHELSFRRRISYELPATIQSFDAGTHTVVVQPVGILGTFWKDIPVAVTITGSDCAVGSYYAVALFNDSNPTDTIVLAAWA